MGGGEILYSCFRLPAEAYQLPIPSWSAFFFFFKFKCHLSVGDYKKFIMRWQLHLLGLKQRFKVFSIYHFVSHNLYLFSSPVKKAGELGLGCVKFTGLAVGCCVAFHNFFHFPVHIIIIISQSFKISFWKCYRRAAYYYKRKRGSDKAEKDLKISISLPSTFLQTCY